MPRALATLWKHSPVKRIYSPHPSHAPAAPVDLKNVSDDDLERWVQFAASHVGIEAEPVQSSYSEVDALVQGAGSAILEFIFRFANGDSDEPIRRGYLALVRGGAMITLLGPDLALHRVSAQLLHDAECRFVEAPYTEAVDEILARAQVPQRNARASGNYF